MFHYAFKRLLHPEMSGIETERPFRGPQWRRLSRPVALVALPDRLEKASEVNIHSLISQLVISPPGAHLGARGQKHLPRRVGEYHRPHVPSVGDQPRGTPKPALAFEQGGPHRRERRDARCSGARLLGAHLPGHVLPVEQDAVAAELEVEIGGKPHETRGLGRREGAACRGEAEHPVEHAAVQAVPAEAFGDGPADRTLAGSIGAVDAEHGDRHSRSSTSTPAARASVVNPGNEVATFAQSSISIGPSAARAASAKVIAIR